MNKKPKLELTWIGKDQQPRLEPRILIEDPEKSYGDKNTENMLIYGDNLLALKALEQDFSGKIKCIYIDPPYNTGSAFEHYDDNLEHSVWLNLIRPRLELLKNLLHDTEGTIWISIDADESHYLKVLCDEIFGRGNFIDEVIWQRSYAPINLKKTFSRNHDTILVYAKNFSTVILNKLLRSEKLNKTFSNPDNDPRGPWASGPIQVGPRIESKTYEIVTPSGRKIIPPAQACWRYTKEKYLEMVADNRIYFGPEGNNVPRIKRFLSEVRDGVVPMTLWLREEAGDNQEAKKEIKTLFDTEVFDTPKPERLIERIITLGSNTEDWILDSFLGSGTTSAVAHKMNRKWIGIELGEHCHTHCLPRLKKVCDGTDQGGISELVEWKGGGGFKYYYLAPSLLKQDKYGNWIIEEKYNANMLAAAMAKHNSFKYQPSEDVYWKQGQSSEKDFIYTTTQFITVEKLDQIHEEMQPDESLLICCKKYSKPCENRYENITIKKIPQMLLGKCEFGREDYSLNIISMPRNENEPEFVPKGPDKKKVVKEESNTPDLFEENNGEEE